MHETLREGGKRKKVGELSGNERVFGLKLVGRSDGFSAVLTSTFPFFGGREYFYFFSVACKAILNGPRRSFDIASLF